MKALLRISAIISCASVFLYSVTTSAQLMDEGPISEKVSDTVKLKNFVTHHLELAREEVTKVKESTTDPSFSGF